VIVMATVKPATAPYQLHVTRVGESTLHEVAAKNYGDANLWEQVHEANPGLNPYAIQPGTMVVIPNRPGSPAAGQAGAAG
jgi:nucleoid-associated protein YgaU